MFYSILQVSVTDIGVYRVFAALFGMKFPSLGDDVLSLLDLAFIKFK